MDAETPTKNQPLAEIVDEATRITEAARERGTTAQLIGGLAIHLRCPSASRPPLQRAYKDIDLATSRSMVTKLSELLEELGHSPDKRFNAIHGSQRLFFWDETNGRQLDVFVDRFEMCHTVDLRNRIALDPTAPTLPLADLLLTKMQVVELNLKDMQDIAALLQDHPLTENEEGINVAYITQLTRSDWGLNHTLELTARKLQTEENLSRVKAESPRYGLFDQLEALIESMDGAPKSIGWKLRSKVGERKRWYELPEEAHQG